MKLVEVTLPSIELLRQLQQVYTIDANENQTMVANMVFLDYQPVGVQCCFEFRMEYSKGVTALDNAARTIFRIYEEPFVPSIRSVLYKIPELTLEYFTKTFKERNDRLHVVIKIVQSLIKTHGFDLDSKDVSALDFCLNQLNEVIVPLESIKELWGTH